MKDSLKVVAKIIGMIVVFTILSISFDASHFNGIDEDEKDDDKIMNRL